MNLSSPTQSLQARAQPGGITPELIRLLAQMKVKQETDAAARDMAMKMGQQPPTVAEGLNEELEGNARQQITQKLGGLQAIAQQQAPQGAPTMPAPPAQPTQHMAAGGLARVKSNLPTQYAGGGIVAFGDPKLNPEEDQQVPAADTPLTMAELWEKIKAHASGPGVSERIRRSVTGPLREYLSAPAYSNEGRAIPAPPIPEDHTPSYGAAPKVPPVVGQLRANASASGRQPPAGLAAAAQQFSLSPEQAALQKTTSDRATAMMNADPNAVETAQREAYRLRQQTALGADQAALRAARQQDYEQAKAAQAARDSKGELSIWDRLGTLGQNAAYGNWGRAAGQQRGMELAHETQKASGLEALLKRKGEMDAMQLNDKKEAFGAAEGVGTAARTAAIGQQKVGVEAGASLTNTAENALQRKQTGSDAAQARLLTAQMAAQARNDAKAAGADTKALALMAASQNNAMRNAEKQAEAAAKNVVRGMEVDVPTLTLKLYNDFLAADPVYKQVMAQLGIKTTVQPAPGGTIPLTPEQEAKRKKILGG